MPPEQLARGIKFLRMMIECLNTTFFAPALYWQTKDYEKISSSVEEVQSMLGDCGIVYLVNIIIST